MKFCIFGEIKNVHFNQNFIGKISRNVQIEKEILIR